MRQRLRHLRPWTLLTALVLCAAGNADGEELEVKCDVKAFNLWDDAGTGSLNHVTFYGAPQQKSGYYPVGVTADNQERGKRSTLCLVKDVSTTRDALAPPVDYKRIWWTRGSGATRDCSIWMPIAPANYVAVGFVVQASYRKPDRDAIRCVRTDLTVVGAAKVLPEAPKQLMGAVYKDFGTRAFEDLSVWRVKAVKADDGFDVGAVFAWATRTMPTKKQDGVRLLRRDAVRVSK